METKQRTFGQTRDFHWWKPKKNALEGLPYTVFKVPGDLTRTQKFFYAMAKAAVAREDRLWITALAWIDTARIYQDRGKGLRLV